MAEVIIKEQTHIAVGEIVRVEVRLKDRIIGLSVLRDRNEPPTIGLIEIMENGDSTDLYTKTRNTEIREKETQVMNANDKE